MVRRVFSKILAATFRLEEYVFSTYKPPTYQYNSAIVDPMIDLLELSGLAMIYAVLRDDGPDNLIPQAWVTYINSLTQPEDAAKHILDVLDLADGGLSFGISARSIARTEWETRLSKRIVEADYARPEYIPMGSQPTWDAPPLIKMLSVSSSMLSLSIKPRAIFAAEIIGPLSGEPEETLRARPGLRRYYESWDFHSKSDTSDETGEGESRDGGDASSQEGSQ